MRREDRRRLAGPLALAAVCALCAWLVAAASARAAAAPVRATALQAGSAERKLGSDPARAPRLSWQLRSSLRGVRQTAYQVQVASSAALLRAGTADVWDSGRVDADRSVDVRYGGPALAARTRYHWRVRVWTTRGNSPWSAGTWWETAIAPGTSWGGNWITHHQQGATPVAQTTMTGAWDLGALTTLGQTFRCDGAFTTAAVQFTEHSSHHDSAVTVRLRSGGVGGTIVATKRFENVRPGQWLTLDTTGTPWPAGSYYLEATGQEVRGDGRVGWFATVNDVYANGSAHHDGVPVGGDFVFRAGLRSMPFATRKEVTLGKQVARARAYVSGLGIYGLSINGRGVTQDLLTPGYTDYRKRVIYQTYDVTKLLRQGGNALAATIGEGWFSGSVPPESWRQAYGEQPAFRLRLDVTFTDDTTQTITTDSTWKSTLDGPLRQGDLFQGETWDATREQAGWDQPGFADAAWGAARVHDEEASRAPLVPEVAPPVRAEQRVRPVAVRDVGGGRFVYDFGQGIAGWARLTVNGTRGTRVRLRYSSHVNPDGTLYTRHLRTAAQTDEYTLKGGGTEVYEPRFTFHGYRYVEVTGFPGTPKRRNLASVVIRTQSPRIGSFTTSSDYVNDLQRTIEWTHRGHWIGTPFDTPDRDEREGWVDTTIFGETAAFGTDDVRFFTKWMDDWRDVQREDGAVTIAAPWIPTIPHVPGSPYITQVMSHTPWLIWQRRGDTSLIEANWGAMTRWLDRMTAESRSGLLPGGGYGDVHTLDVTNPTRIVENALFARAAREMAEMARAIGRGADATRYAALHDQIRRAFAAAYVSADGRVLDGPETQTGYIIALAMDVVPADLRDEAAGHLARLIRDAGGHLLSGYAGAPYALQALSGAGQDALAVQLLTNRTFPSWGWMLEMGATTFWEQWNSLNPDGAVNEQQAAVSLNHTPLANFGDWLYRIVGGLDLGSEEPGYRRIVVRPFAQEGLVDWAWTRHRSPYGKVGVRWTRGEDGAITVGVRVPPNTSATVHVPAACAAAVLERDEPAQDADGVTLLGASGGEVRFAVGSGRYRFAVDAESLEACTP